MLLVVETNAPFYVYIYKYQELIALGLNVTCCFGLAWYHITNSHELHLICKFWKYATLAYQTG